MCNTCWCSNQTVDSKRGRKGRKQGKKGEASSTLSACVSDGGPPDMGALCIWSVLMWVPLQFSRFSYGNGYTYFDNCHPSPKYLKSHSCTVVVLEATLSQFLTAVWLDLSPSNLLPILQVSSLLNTHTMLNPRLQSETVDENGGVLCNSYCRRNRSPRGLSLNCLLPPWFTTEWIMKASMYTPLTEL